jgi:hypothetical protein
MLLLPPPSVTGLLEQYDEYSRGSEAERTGGRRNRCLSLRPVGGARADTETERGVSAGGRCSLRYDGSRDGNDEVVELARVGC